MINKVVEITQANAVGGFTKGSISPEQYDDRVHDFSWWFPNSTEAWEFMTLVNKEVPSIRLHGPYTPKVPSSEEHKDKVYVALVEPSDEETAEQVDTLVEKYYEADED